MNNKMLKITYQMALAIIALIVFAQIPVFAQFDPDPRENGRQMEGTWNIITTNRDCATGTLSRSYPSMETFARGGTSVEFSLGAATSGLANLGNRTASQGVWHYVSNGVYSSASQFYRFDIANVYIGSGRRDAEILLSNDGDSFTSLGTEKFFNTVGVLTGTRCNSQAGTRFE